jgi:hypothetical protein
MIAIAMQGSCKGTTKVRHVAIVVAILLQDIEDIALYNHRTRGAKRRTVLQCCERLSLRSVQYMLTKLEQSKYLKI